MSKKELFQEFNIGDDDYLARYELLDKKCLFEFGKYESFNSNEEIFTQLDDEGDFQIISKEEIIGILDKIREKVKKHYEELLYAQNCNLTRKKLKKIHDREYNKDFNQINFELANRAKRLYATTPKGYVKKNLEDKIKVWKDLESVNYSWLWEYEFFNLREVINTFDFEKDLMIYYGY